MTVVQKCASRTSHEHSVLLLALVRLYAKTASKEIASDTAAILPLEMNDLQKGIKTKIELPLE